MLCKGIAGVDHDLVHQSLRCAAGADGLRVKSLIQTYLVGKKLAMKGEPYAQEAQEIVIEAETRLRAVLALRQAGRRRRPPLLLTA
jgi:hypothetical protein